MIVVKHQHSGGTGGVQPAGRATADVISELLDAYQLALRLFQGSAYFSGEAEFQPCAPVHRQSIPLKIGRRGRVYLNERDGKELGPQQRVVDPKVCTLGVPGLAVKVQPLGESHCRHTDIDNNIVRPKCVDADSVWKRAIHP